VPLAFQIAAESAGGVETRARMACRESIRQMTLLEQILPDFDRVLQVEDLSHQDKPGEEITGEPWWNPESEGEMVIMLLNDVPAGCAAS